MNPSKCHNILLLVSTAICLSAVPLKATAGPLDHQWLCEYDDPASPWDVVKDLATDNRGGAVVTGSVTVRVSVAGSFASDSGGWVRPGGDAVAIDEDGNVFVMSTVSDAGTGKNFLTRKYDPAGLLLWERRFNGSANGTDSAVALAIDHDGNAFVVGRSTGQTTGQDCVTIKYNSDGDTAQGSGGWVRRFLIPDTNSYEIANNVETGPDGSVYILGTTSSNGNHYFVVKYSATGDTAVSSGGWVCRNVGVGFNFGKAIALCVDSQGSVGVAGWMPHDRCCSGDWTNSDYWTSRISPEGVQLWTRTYGGYGYDSKAADLEADAEGYLYVTGKSRYYADTGSDFITVKYDPSGEIVWQVPFRGARNFLGRSDAAKSLAIGPSGTLFVTGNSMRQNLFFNFDVQFATVAMDPISGTGIDSAYYDKYTYGNEDVVAVETDTLGNVFVAGLSCDPYGTTGCASTTMIIIKYGEGIMSGVFDEPAIPLPGDFAVGANYPNPFNGGTTIPLELAHDARLRIVIFNVLGQPVRTLIDSDFPQGDHAVSWDGKNQAGKPQATGVYFYGVFSDRFRDFRKMMLIK